MVTPRKSSRYTCWFPSNPLPFECFGCFCIESAPHVFWICDIQVHLRLNDPKDAIETGTSIVKCSCFFRSTPIGIKGHVFGCWPRFLPSTERTALLGHNNDLCILVSSLNSPCSTILSWPFYLTGWLACKFVKENCAPQMFRIHFLKGLSYVICRLLITQLLVLSQSNHSFDINWHCFLPLLRCISDVLLNVRHYALQFVLKVSFNQMSCLAACGFLAFVFFLNC